MPSNTQAQPHDATIERLRAVWIHRLLCLAAPWAVAGAVAVGAVKANAAWGNHGARTAAAVAGLAVGAVVVTFAAWHATRHRAAVLRAHSAATAAAGGAWLCIVVVTGIHAQVTGFLGVVLGCVVCLTWNLRRPHERDHASGPAARISDLFEDAADPAGMKGAKLSVREVAGRKVRGLVRLVPGEQTAADLVRRLPNVESGMRLPPGSLTAAEHPDRADLAQVTLTNPRLMRKPILWPGPSRPGGSIAEPISPGVWQDFDPVQWTVTGHHVQVMGMTGSAKSLGGGWNYLGETITREDAAVFGADITKGEQTLGPLRPALHGLATDLPGVRGLLSDMRYVVRPRTDYLASRGLQRWERGCGLTYLVVWLEECPDILDALTAKQMDAFESLVKAMRSAGMTIGMSLQRSTYDQMPTLLRGQLANWCFGVANSSDAKYGLSERQEDAGAAPERWQNGQPGMSYLDAPGIPDDRIAMPLRCFFWGDDAKLMTAHAAAFPASERPLDPLTARLLADAAAARQTAAPRPAGPRPAAALRAVEPASDDDEDQADELPEADDDDDGLDPEDDPETVRAEYLTEPDPDPEVTAELDDPIELPGDDDAFAELEFPAAGRLDPAEARQRFRDLLAEWVEEGRQEFATSDLYELLSAVGMSRAWLHKQINLAIEEGLIEPVTDAERGRFGRYELCEPVPGAA